MVDNVGFFLFLFFLNKAIENIQLGGNVDTIKSGVN